MADDSLHDIEEWRPVPGYVGLYSVSSHGRVRSGIASRTTPAGYIRKRTLRSDGYLTVPLYKDRRPRGWLVHVLVCAAFCGSQPTPKHEVAHWDGDRANCRKGNLRWATRGSNEADVLQIRQLCADGVGQQTIAARFNVDHATVSMISRRKIWRHI